MGTVTSEITSLTTVYSTVYSDADKKKHQSSASLAFVRGTGEFPAQMASNAENVSIWWRHHVITYLVKLYMFILSYTPSWRKHLESEASNSEAKFAKKLCQVPLRDLYAALSLERPSKGWHKAVICGICRLPSTGLSPQLKWHQTTRGKTENSALQQTILNVIMKKEYTTT